MKSDVRDGNAALLGLVALAVALPCASLASDRDIAAYDRPEARATQARLARGWNTWDSRSVLTWVRLPEAFAINLAFKQFTWIGHEYLATALIGRKGDAAERIRPGWHALDGRYTELELRWQDVAVRVETAHTGEDLVVLLSPIELPKRAVTLVVETGLLWNKPGTLARSGSMLEARVGGRTLQVFTTGRPVEDPYIPAKTPYLALPFDAMLAVSTGRPRSLNEVRRLVAEARTRHERESERHGALVESWRAVESALGWNTIYEPRHDRVVATVGRLWNEEYGGYALFGWDNFLLAYLAAPLDRNLAVATFVEHLRSKTDDGFIPNDDRGNGTKSWDHSQPPVGALMLRELYRRFEERWLLEAAFDDLLAWNRWWPRARLNDGLLSYGSHAAPNPYGQQSVRSKTTAGYESGMDDSPMYEDVPFNSSKNTLELQDVGLNSLYVADCRALAEIAGVIGRRTEAEELTARAAVFAERLEALWHEPTGFYLNRRTDTGAVSTRLSPTLFYPLLARLPDATRAERMLARHFFNPAAFHGPHMLPSIARDDPAFPKQRYWKGAVWPPLNLLVYLGLRNYGLRDAARELAEKSQALLVDGWRRNGHVSENYSALTGGGDAEHLSSDVFHTWGALLAVPAFVEAGVLGAPEDPLGPRAPTSPHR